MKVVINRSYGGFSLSKKAAEYLNQKYNLKCYPFEENRYYDVDNLPRNDPRLIDCVETLGESANGYFAKLRIVEIPDDVDWEVNEYDGTETIHEKHRIWY